MGWIWYSPIYSVPFSKYNSLPSVYKLFFTTCANSVGSLNKFFTPGRALSYLATTLVLISSAFSPKDHLILNTWYKLISNLVLFCDIES